ncbi:MAG: hypothetical protein AB9834_19305 [Lentimicrobium sp.]
MKTLKNILCALFIMISLIISTSGQLFGQVEDTTFTKEFNAFNKQINQEFNAFISHNDSVFILFLMNSWKEFESKQNPMPVSPKPVEQPKYHSPETNKLQQDSVTPEIYNDPGISPNKENPIPQKDASENAPMGNSFSFYGNRIALPISNGRLPSLASVTRQGIVDFFKASRSELLEEITKSLKEKSDKAKLNDWGFASMLLQAAQTYYFNVNEQLLFCWVAMLQSGYNVKVGYSINRIYLLIPADVQLYTMSYTIGNRDYYVLGPGSVPSESEKVFIYEGDYPDSKSDFSFRLTESPRFDYQETQRTLYYEKTLNLKLNRNLLDFYQNYPPCDLAVYFSTPVSGYAMQQLDEFFLPLLKGKTETEQVAVLLDFMHRAIRYKIDQVQFGKERYLFPDETLFYPAADCEDRSALFARLINRYTKLDAIGLCYPMHVSVAVNLPSCEGEDYVMFRNKRFYHCDPTYLGAGCGMAMQSILKTVPEIINFSGI